MTRVHARRTRRLGKGDGCALPRRRRSSRRSGGSRATQSRRGRRRRRRRNGGGGRAPALCARCLLGSGTGLASPANRTRRSPPTMRIEHACRQCRRTGRVRGSSGEGAAAGQGQARAAGASARGRGKRARARAQTIQRRGTTSLSSKLSEWKRLPAKLSHNDVLLRFVPCPTVEGPVRPA